MGRILDTLELAIIGIAALCVAAIMIIVSIDATLRYTINSPLPWAFDLITYYLLIAALYLAVSATFRSGDHINIDLFRGLIPVRLRNLIDVVWCLLAAVAFAIITYGAWQEMSGAYRHREFLPGYIAWPAWASYLPIVVGSGVAVLRLLLHSYELIVHGEDEDVVVSGEHHE